MSEPDRTRRNLNPHKAAYAAMYLYGPEYAAQRGGSMDFWDKLSESKRRVCRDLVAAVLKAPAEPTR
jgi:hypothetical protein